ncbi:Zn-finger protein [Pyrenophora tritici-repentis]|nr:Zn-finger protein [Pyrenophora tritici-repentis]KAF7449205.1 Zn-finger protein [Pyrenophora tritici-repentis]KAI0589072.1 Zn-finger protein [Pyrenophora tritici-repentis]KAI0591230.1 Zn-finger protein [Pyrenophora tritici-repentis]KAI0615569.1 Zn-finger protein [Pyrenophora tritici-repentis]
MGAPPSFATRRPHAQQLGSFELPPPTMHKYPFTNTVTASHSPQAPTTIASVGNLLTPPNTNHGDLLSSSGVSTTNAQYSTTMAYSNGQYMYSPPTQASTAHYGYPTAHHQQNQYSQARGGMFAPPRSDGQIGRQDSLGKGLNPPPYEMNQQLPPFTPSSNGSTPQQSPALSQDSFRPPQPPTPTYNYHASGTPQHSNFPYSTGPSPTLSQQQSPISAGGSMPRMSPAVSQGSIPSIPSNNPAHSPYQYQQRPSLQYSGGQPPVFSNVQNTNGGLALVGGHPMMPGFNSGHAAAMPHFMGHPQHQQPAPNDRPFKCDQCPQSFNRNHDLKRHKRIHLAVKPFPCNHCDKSFSRKDALKRHILVKGCGKANANDDTKRESHSPKAEDSK